MKKEVQTLERLIAKLKSFDVWGDWNPNYFNETKSKIKELEEAIDKLLKSNK